jgi:hypothetical protein
MLESGRPPSAETGRFESSKLDPRQLSGEPQLPAYSVEKLHGKILLKYSRALETLKFERAEGPLDSGEISPQSISIRQTGCLCLVFRHKLIQARNLLSPGN